MLPDNYRDLSSYSGDLETGFQFEFACGGCGRKWTTAFKPYRLGQFAGLLSLISPILPNSVAISRAAGGLNNAKLRGAHEAALADAQKGAASRYRQCTGCHQWQCDDCLDERSGQCRSCLPKNMPSAAASTTAASAATSATCPNCRTPNAGGRFCAECGFDMASTHKSCPGCGAMQPRQARFCTDCGHGF